MDRQFKGSATDHEEKTFSFEVKEVDEDEGIFTGYAATFSDTPDSYGDIIDKGAFKKTLKEGSKRIKILWNHYILEPIGKPIEMLEDDHGLLVKGKLSLGVQRAREVLSLMKDGVVTEMSIGYDTIKQTRTEGIRHLQEIKLWDVSPVTFAANPDALILGVKAELKPYPNEHACRLRDPDDFQDGSFKRTSRVSDGKKYSVIMGKLEGENTMTEQAYRYDKEVWEEVDAKTHCKDHDGKFEAAEKQSKAGRVLSAANLEKVKKAFDALQALLESLEGEEEPAKATHLSDEATAEVVKLETLVNTLKAENEGFDTKEAEGRIEAILDKLTK